MAGLSNFFNRVLFAATAGGTADFTVGAAATGYSTPAQRGVPNNTLVSYTAESVDKSQWETGQGLYNAGVVARTTIRESSTGSKVNFSTAPNVWLDDHAQDISFNVFNVKNFGAKGDGTTDDTAAINSAIAALNSTGGGQLYFPTSTYIVSSSLTAITADCIIFGDGATGLQSGAPGTGGTLISYSSSNTALFTFNADETVFHNIALKCTAATPVSPSCGILVTSVVNAAMKADISNFQIQGFFINININTGEFSTVRNGYLLDAVQSNIRVTNSLAFDGGGWLLEGLEIQNPNRSSVAGIQIDGGGGGRIFDCVVVGGNTVNCGVGINGGAPLGHTTVDLHIANCNLENCNNYGIFFKNSGSWDNILIDQMEIQSFGAPTVAAIHLENANQIVISNIISAINPAIQMVGCTSYQIVNAQASGNITMSPFPPVPSVFPGGATSNSSKTVVLGDGGGVYFQVANDGGSSRGASFVIDNYQGFGGGDVGLGLKASGTGGAKIYLADVNNTTYQWLLYKDASANLKFNQGGPLPGADIVIISPTADADFQLLVRRLLLAAATTARASLNIPSSSGTAPSSPVDGDIWYDGTNLKFRLGGTTKSFTLA